MRLNDPRSRTIAALLGAPVFLGGCALPIPTPEDTLLSGVRVTQEQLAFLTPSVTTSTEVIAQLGNPHLIWEDARIYAYDWEMRQGILVWVVAGPASAAMGVEDIPKRYALLIEFDETWHVRRFERTTRDWFTSYASFLREWKAKAPDPARAEAR